MSILEFKVLTAHVRDDAYVLTLSGEADMYDAPELVRELDRVCEDGARRVVVDLVDAAFIDSTILGVLLRLHRRLRGAGGELVLVAPDRRVRRALEITGLDRTFAIAATLTDALSTALRPEAA